MQPKDREVFALIKDYYEVLFSMNTYCCSLSVCVLKCLLLSPSVIIFDYLNFYHCIVDTPTNP